MSDSEIDDTRPIRVPPLPEETQPLRVPPSTPEETRPVRVSSSPTSATQPVQAVPVQEEPPPPEGAQPVQASPNRRGMRWGWVVLLGILFTLLMGGIGGYFGYREALRWRLENEQVQKIVEAKTQYDLALQDVKDGHLETAQQRFNYIIELAPDFPGIKEQLTHVMVSMQQTAVPTEVPTATPIPLTPTPDTRTEQDIFAQIQQALKDKKWDAAITAIEALRAQNLTYRPVDVDGMYYIALRYRGTDKILRLADLEGGMYDLTLAERFGPLDRDAVSYQTWARTYLTGASFWMVDWEKVVYYFAQVASAAPSLMDGSKMTAAERYKIALIKWGDKLAPDEPCKAATEYAAVLALGKLPTLEAGATRVAERCSPPTATSQPKTPTLTPMPTLTGTLETPTTGAATETPTPTQPAAQPTITPTPTQPAAQPTITPTHTQAAPQPTATPTNTANPPTITPTHTPTP